MIVAAANTTRQTSATVLQPSAMTKKQR